MPCPRAGLAFAAAIGATVVAAVSGAAATVVDTSEAPQLRVQTGDILNPAVIAVSGERPITKTIVGVPKGYTLDATRPTGTEIGFAVGVGTSDEEHASVGGGPLTLEDPAAATHDPAAQACDAAPHLAVLAASLRDASLGASAELTVFVDAGDPAAAYVLVSCPPSLAGQQLAAVELSLDARLLVSPMRPAVYRWSALVTPTVDGGTAPATAGTIELRAAVPVPDTLAFEATYDAKTHATLLSGRYLAASRPQPAAAVSVHAASAHASADIGPLRTDRRGRFTYRWATREPTTFTARVRSLPARPCSGTSAAPGGCLSTTTSVPADVSVRVVPRTRRDPRLALRAADRRLALEVGLRRSDLPAGWQALPSARGPRTVCEGFDPEEADLTETASHTSVFVSRPSFDFAAVAASSTTVLATRRQAASYFAREGRLARVACFAREARAAGGTARAARMRVPRLGRGTIGFRITSEQDGQTFYFDELGVLGSRSVTFLMCTSEETPPSFELRLAATIAARARRG